MLKIYFLDRYSGANPGSSGYRSYSSEVLFMELGNSLFQARKKCGLSQEEVAEKLGVSRQTISKWETNETLPDIRQSKRLAVLYRLSLDELIDFDIDIQGVQQAIERSTPALEEKIDWTKAWGDRKSVV